MTGLTQRGHDDGGSPLSWLADPVHFQLAFSALYGLDVAIRAAFGYRFAIGANPGLALMAAVALLAVAVLVPWDRLDPRAALVLPIADIAVISLTRLVPEGGNALLVVFPALWLGRQWGRVGVAVTGVAAALLVLVPGVWYAGFEPVPTSRTLFVPIVAVVAAYVISDGIQQVRDQTAEIEVQRDRLAGALTTIAHQQRVTQAVFDTVDVGLVLLDAEGRYVTVNRRHQEFIAVGFPDGHAGRAGQLGAVFDVDGRTPLETEQMPSTRASQGEEFDDVRMWIGVEPSARRALSVSARTVRDEAGRFAGAALAYTDVTDFMRALRVKDEFVALVSHELRTPLTSIVGYVQILEDDPALPPHAIDQLRVVHRNAERLRRLIADLLDTAQRDGSPMPIARGRHDLAAIVVESVEAARPAADKAGVRLDLVAPDVVPMQLDAQRMAQVVDNLVSNAIKYTEPGGTVAVTLTADEQTVVLEVTDTGIGISADDRERLFTRFFRTEDAARRAVAGAGLGLSITKDIVESHGGRIEVDSTPGAGSRFLVRMPLAGRPAVRV